MVGRNIANIYIFIKSTDSRLFFVVLRCSYLQIYSFLCLKNENIMEGLLLQPKRIHLPTYLYREGGCNNRRYSCTQSKQSTKYLKYL